jgi:ribosomal protein L7Ae-like RNA K-turn-binding protein
MGGRRVRFNVRFFVSIWDFILYITGVLGIQLVTKYVLSSKLDFIVTSPDMGRFRYMYVLDSLCRSQLIARMKQKASSYMGICLGVTAST